jgi:dihydrofolate reductase
MPELLSTRVLAGVAKTILYMAMSVDGLIAGNDDEIPLSDDEWAAYDAFIRSCDAVIVGRRTYEIMRDKDELASGVNYLVATQSAQADTGRFKKIAIADKKDLPVVPAKLGVIGGGELNGRLAKLGVIDEIILDTEAIILGDGKSLFGSHDTQLKLELLSSCRVGPSTVQNHYRVL